MAENIHEQCPVKCCMRLLVNAKSFFSVELTAEYTDSGRSLLYDVLKLEMNERPMQAEATYIY